ncbi:hypothetical protein [Streptomyces sp. NPDC048636]|uniref:hypothetical protein n=1 Tax=Streptomyces sp. NPDC048636 TaxID=3155762 RepID=UPI0034281679
MDIALAALAVCERFAVFWAFVFRVFLADGPADVFAALAVLAVDVAAVLDAVLAVDLAVDALFLAAVADLAAAVDALFLAVDAVFLAVAAEARLVAAPVEVPLLARPPPPDFAVAPVLVAVPAVFVCAAFVCADLGAARDFAGVPPEPAAAFAVAGEPPRPELVGVVTCLTSTRDERRNLLPFSG